jgi:hypothetical protein
MAILCQEITQSDSNINSLDLHKGTARDVENINDIITHPTLRHIHLTWREFLQCLRIAALIRSLIRE